MKNKISIRISTLLLLIMLFSSCAYINYGLMSNDGKRNELRTLSAKVVKAVSWGEFEEVAIFMNEEIRDKAVRQLEDQYKSIKIKEVKETNLDFDDEVLNAYQVLEIAGFSAPSYIVQTEFTQFKWTFSTSTHGWKISEIKFATSDSSFTK